MNKISYGGLIAFHPGYYIEELLEDFSITKKELAQKLGTTVNNLKDIINGKKELSYEIAVKLSVVFETSVDMWVNLNNSYNQKKSEIEKLAKIDEDVVRNMDYSFWSILGLVPKVNKSIDKASELKKYFGISSLSELSNKDLLVQFRTAVSDINDINIINANAWVKTAISIGKSIKVEDYNDTKLKRILPKIRNMTLQSTNFVPELKALLGECGVAFVLLPSLKNCGVNGAVTWDDNKAILALNNRRRYADTFWFSLFHEIGHVLQKQKKLLIISGKSANIFVEVENLEKEADLFAQDTLIPRDEYKSFLSLNSFELSSIIRFSNNIKIHPGIVIGRLQNDGYIPYRSNLNRYRVKYNINIE